MGQCNSHSPNLQYLNSRETVLEDQGKATCCPYSFYQKDKFLYDGEHYELGWPMKLPSSIFPSCLFHSGCWQALNTSSNWGTTDLLLFGYTEADTGFGAPPCPTIPTASTDPSGTGARVQPRGVITCNTPLPLHRVPVSTQHLCMVFFICSIVFSLEKNDSKTLINPQALKDLNYCYIHASHIMSNIGPQFKISNEKKKILTNAC